MVSDFGVTRYCRECKGEIAFEDDAITMYAGKKICPRKRAKPYECGNKMEQGEPK